MATGSTMHKRSLEVPKENEKRKDEPISIEIRCGAHELPRRCKRGTPNFKGYPRKYRSETVFERNHLRPRQAATKSKTESKSGLKVTYRGETDRVTLAKVLSRLLSDELK